MNYEEKYKKSLDRAMNLFVTNNISATAVCEIFPELNESEEVNYVKKYKDALERASKLKVQNPFDTVGQMVEHIFPEFKESEDERIRQHLIDCVNRTISEASAFKDISKEDILAWLEKQGKQKTCITEETVPKFKAGNKIIFTNGNVEKIASVGTHGYTFASGDWLPHECVEKDAKLYKD